MAQDTEERERSEPKEKNRKKEGGGSGPSAGANGKGKDLSHVPCKFYRIGGCTAGAACPFSHSAATDSREKDVCAWFVKGNCKFGHKCALAHILPGQGMSMDRKNKRAAAVAAGAGKDRDRGDKGGRERDRDAKPPSRSTKKSALPPGMTGLSLKASMSPSAPAPALKDTDFKPSPLSGSGGSPGEGGSGASSGLANELRKMQEAEAERTLKEKEKEENQKPSFAAALKAKPAPPSAEVKEEAAPLPVSTPRMSLSPSKHPDFGPIGSPPRAIGVSPHRSNALADNGEGGEMLVPGSLSDLLTADELARRQGGVATSTPTPPSIEALSRSVPLPSLLSSSTPHPPAAQSATHPPPGLGFDGGAGMSVSPSIWSSPPPGAYLNLAPSNASGAFLLRDPPHPPPPQHNPASYGAAYGLGSAGLGPSVGVGGGYERGGVGMSLPQGLAAGYSRIHARPSASSYRDSPISASFRDPALSGSFRDPSSFRDPPMSASWRERELGLGVAAGGKTREWGASSFGTAAGGSPGSLPTWNNSYFAHPMRSPEAGRTALSPTSAGFNVEGFPRSAYPAGTSFRDRFADRQAGIATVREEKTEKANDGDGDDDLFVLDG